LPPVWSGGDGRKGIARGCVKSVIYARLMLTSLARSREEEK